MESKTSLRRVMMKNEDGETVPVDLDELRRDYEEWKDIIGQVFMIESMTITTRSEFDRIPAKYHAIATTIGADRFSREQEGHALLRTLGGM